METVKFEELGLYPQLLRAIKEMGFEESNTYPVTGDSGCDEWGRCDWSGTDRTGKTASFGIPLLMKVNLIIIKKRRQSYFLRQENWPSRVRKKSGNLQNICMGSKCFPFMEGRIFPVRSRH